MTDSQFLLMQQEFSDLPQFAEGLEIVAVLFDSESQIVLRYLQPVGRVKS